VLVLALALAAGAAARADRQTGLDALVERARGGDCPGAIPGLERLASGQDLEALRAAHLLGHCLARVGRHAEAARAFEAAAAHPTLQVYARLEAGRALYAAGDPAAAAPLIHAIAASAEGRLRGRALVVLGEVEQALGRHRESAAAFAAAAEIQPYAPAVWLQLGRAAVAAGQQDRARLALSRAAWGFPGDPVETVAAQDLARLLRRPATAADMDPESRLLRGKRLAQLGESRQAQVEFRAATAGPGEIGAEAWYRLGRLLLSSSPADAHRAFRTAALRGWSAEAWFWAESAARRAGMTSEARGALQALLRTAPRGLWTGRYWLNAGLRAEGAGRIADAAAHYRRAVQAAPAEDPGIEAAWRLGWVALRAGNRGEAAARFRTAGQSAPTAWRSAAARAWYWAARSLEAGRPADRAEAGRIIRLVAEQYPLTYYGQRARARLGWGPAAVPAGVAPVRHLSAPGPAHEELAWLGLDVEAADAAEDLLAALGDRRDADPRLSRFLAGAYARLGDIPRSVEHAEHALAYGVRDQTTWRLAYPRAYWPEVTAAARAARIDPLLLLALVREESRYDAVALSPARAVGLAQLLLSTAREVSGDATLDLGRLQDPATNLTLGARYLRRQIDRFGGDLRLALAAYNAGPGAARRWVNLDPDPDYFIERIPYSETRAYIRRVLGSYGIYQLLW
jgi:soluble lytic murein transglycosylase